MLKAEEQVKTSLRRARSVLYLVPATEQQLLAAIESAETYVRNPNSETLEAVNKSILIVGTIGLRAGWTEIAGIKQRVATTVACSVEAAFWLYKDQRMLEKAVNLAEDWFSGIEKL